MSGIVTVVVAQKGIFYKLPSLFPSHRLEKLHSGLLGRRVGAGGAGIGTPNPRGMPALVARPWIVVEPCHVGLAACH